jgi:hypothetical protein
MYNYFILLAEPPRLPASPAVSPSYLTGRTRLSAPRSEPRPSNPPPEHPLSTPWDLHLSSHGHSYAACGSSTACTPGTQDPTSRGHDEERRQRENAGRSRSHSTPPSPTLQANPPAHTSVAGTGLASTQLTAAARCTPGRSTTQSSSGHLSCLQTHLPVQANHAEHHRASAAVAQTKQANVEARQTQQLDCEDGSCRTRHGGTLQLQDCRGSWRHGKRPMQQQNAVVRLWKKARLLRPCPRP